MSFLQGLLKWPDDCRNVIFERYRLRLGVRAASEARRRFSNAVFARMDCSRMFAKGNGSVPPCGISVAEHFPPAKSRIQGHSILFKFIQAY
jgi:hypothetical protein